MSSIARTTRPIVNIPSRRRQARRLALLEFDRLDDRVMLSVSGGTTLAVRSVADAPFPTNVVEFSTDPSADSGVEVQYATTNYSVLNASGGAQVEPLGSATPYGFRPSQIAKAYGFDQAILPGGIVGDGAGQTIVILDAYDNPNIVNDLHQFDLAFGIPDPPSFTVYKQTVGGSSPPANGGWALEIALDVQWAHALAPKANIILAEAYSASTTNLFNTAKYMAAQPGVSVISMSFGSDEWNGQTGPFGDSTFVTPTGHAGVTFIASSGDGGVISYPASSPRVLGVGGTALYLDASGNYASEIGWGGSGGGTSQYETRPSYQDGVVTTANRQSPDVSLVADPYTSVAVYDSYNNGAAAPWIGVGGTSASAPMWASLIAIANQGRALNGLTSLDGYSQTLPMLYKLPAADFYDIISGSSAAGSAGVGYDVVTGLGSPRANLVIAGLSGSSTPTSSVPTVGDAGFETVPVGTTYRTNPSGSSWTFAGESGVAGNSSGFAGSVAAPGGTQAAYIQRVGSFGQSVAGWAAGSYAISFSASQSISGYQLEDFQVLVDGVAVGTFRPAGLAYQAFTTASFAVSAGSHTISFVGLDSAGGWNAALIDSVAIATSTPPTTPTTPTAGDAGFETVPVGTTYRTNPSGSSWTFVGESGVAGNSSGFAGSVAAPGGTQAAYIQRVGSFGQVVAGWAAGSYAISFSASQSISGYQLEDFQVLVDGVPVGTFRPAGLAYQAFTTATFAVSAGSHTISFAGLDSAGGWNAALIDSVAIATSTPPTTPTTPTAGDAGFETVPVGTTYRTNPSGSSWTFVGESGLAGNSSGFAGSVVAPGGTQAAYIQRVGSFSQSVAGWAAGSYTISFSASQSISGYQLEDFQVLVDGVPVGTFRPAGLAYQAFTTATFAVSAGSHTITFAGLDSAGGWNAALIDSVSIAAASSPTIIASNALASGDATASGAKGVNPTTPWILAPLPEEASAPIAPVKRVGAQVARPKVAAWKFH